MQRATTTQYTPGATLHKGVRNNGQEDGEIGEFGAQPRAYDGGAHTMAARIRDQAKAVLRRKIDAYLIEHQMSYSELARKAGLPRDHISRYINEKSLPEPVSLRKLARAMDCQPEDLMPSQPSIAYDPATPTMEIVTVPEDPGKVLLHVNQVVSRALAAKIMQLLHDDSAD